MDRPGPARLGGAMASRGCGLLRLLLGAALPLLSSAEAAAVSPERSLAWGPGLEAGLALPVRYFHLQAVSAAGHNFTRSPPGTVLGLRGWGRAASPAPGAAGLLPSPYPLPFPHFLLLSPFSFSLPALCTHPWQPLPSAPALNSSPPLHASSSLRIPVPQRSVILLLPR